MTQNVPVKDLMRSRAGRDALTLMAAGQAVNGDNPFTTAARDVAAIAHDADLANIYAHDVRGAFTELYTRQALHKVHSGDLEGTLEFLGSGIQKSAQRMLLNVQAVTAMRKKFAEPDVFPIDLDEKLMIITEHGHRIYAARAPETDTVVMLHSAQPVTMAHSTSGVSTFTVEGEAPFEGIVRILHLDTPAPSPNQDTSPEI